MGNSKAKEVHKEFRNLKHEMSQVDINRGSDANKLKGFYAEAANATADNIRRIDSGIAARQVVIDNNGNADTIIKYANGQYGREIQYKNGYTYSKHKEFLTSGKYDNMIYAVNQDNSIFSNEKQMEELKKIAKEHNIKLVPAMITDSEMKILASVAKFEGNLKGKIGFDDKPTLTLELYANSKELSYHYNELLKKKNSFNNYIANQTSAFLTEGLVGINSAGISQALNAAQFAAALSVAKNTLNIVKGDEDISEAAREVLKDTSKAAIMGYVTGATAEIANIANMNDAALIVNGAIQITQNVCSYVNGEITEQELLQNTAETTVYLLNAYVGKTLGGMIGAAGGPLGILVGEFVGEIVTTMVCMEITNTIKVSKEFEKENAKKNALYRKAEREIRESQVRLRTLIQQENEELIHDIKAGFEQMLQGIEENSYDKVRTGIVTISTKFGLSEHDFEKGKVTKQNIFLMNNEVLIIE